MRRYVIVHHSGDPVALVSCPGPWSNTDCLELAWRGTNNVEGSWSRGEKFADGTYNRDFSRDVTVLVGLPTDADGNEIGLRSSMVGDVFVLDGRSYKVVSYGFEPVDD